MEAKGYILNRMGIKNEWECKLYCLEDLELMTTHQLREICRNEKIIKGILDPLDKEELVSVIIRFCGKRQQLLIKDDEVMGMERIIPVLSQSELRFKNREGMQINSKIVVYQGRKVTYQDRITLPYHKCLENTNALIIGNDRKICGIFYLAIKGDQKDQLYLLSSGEHAYLEAGLKHYDLYCFEQKDSDTLYNLYYGRTDMIPENLSVYKIPLMDYSVQEPINLRMPVAIDFGTTNTTVGIYLDSQCFDQAGAEVCMEGMNKNSIQYTTFYDTTEGEIKEKKLFPTVVGISSVNSIEPRYVFGYEAIRLSNANYVDEGFCIFYDIKRWVGDYEKEEEITDREGRKQSVKRKDILKAFFHYVIEETQNHFKCKVEKVHISCPMKQKILFHRLFEEIMPDYTMPLDEIVDEGVAVLYQTISGMLEKKNLREDTCYEALIIDCGGGTTDLCACRFQIWDRRVSYRIEVETAYENGDTDFGGNNLTYRIMQFLKLELARACGYKGGSATEQIIRGFDVDVFRFVDKNGTKKLYQQLEEAYEQAENFLPTRFKKYESNSRSEYYMVRNNFYHLFSMAEQIKKRFYDTIGTLKVEVSSMKPEREDAEWIKADKWKLSILREGRLQVLKEFPNLTFDLFCVELLLKGDIYSVIRRFIEPLYESDKVRDFSFIKLTGQSCKIDIFKEALKEFIPGKMIQFKKKNKDDVELKMTCVDGALKYIRDKQLGYVDVEIRSDKPILPYTVSAYTHNGQEVELINGFLREDITKTISRNLDNVTLQLYLKDTDGNIRYSFYCDCRPDTFIRVTYEEIAAVYEQNILQKETDSILNGEIKFFLWKKCKEWGYAVVPIYRNKEILYLGQEKFYPFENEGWVQNYFDGMK